MSTLTVYLSESVENLDVASLFVNLSVFQIELYLKQGLY